MLWLIYKRNTMRLINNRYVNASYSKKNKAFSLRLHALCFFSYDALTYLLLICSIVFLLYCRVRHRFFLFRTSCEHDDENLSLKYIVERTRFYVSLKLEKTVTNCSVEKIIPLKYMVERTSCDRDIRHQLVINLNHMSSQFYV